MALSDSRLSIHYSERFRQTQSRPPHPTPIQLMSETPAPSDGNDSTDTDPATVEEFREKAGIGHADDDVDEAADADRFPDPDLKGEMAEAPEHIQRKAASEMTQEELEKALEYLDDPRREEVEELIQIREDVGEEDTDTDTDADSEPAADSTTESAESEAAPAETTTVAAAAPPSDPSPDGSAQTSPGDDPDDTDDSTDTEESVAPASDSDSDPGTLAETGLTNEDDEFPWESAEETDLGEIETATITVKGTTFDLTEPADSQKIENAGRHLQGVREAPESERKEAAQEYQKELSYAVYTHDGLTLDQLYLFMTPEGEPNRLVNTRDHEGCADHDRTKPFWDALTPIDRSKMGARASNFIEGSGRFQS